MNKQYGNGGANAVFRIRFTTILYVTDWHNADST